MGYRVRVLTQLAALEPQAMHILPLHKSTDNAGAMHRPRQTLLNSTHQISTPRPPTCPAHPHMLWSSASLDSTGKIFLTTRVSSASPPTTWTEGQHLQLISIT